ncbi:membrane protein [Microtetraspora sp. NBRC 13810]|uniref:DMT family transporter n=1 Tax=Microtetraspora sp. NBRC 13810 TaxID=3030990 RepID=UPI0024A42F2C|nr:EamA family transporter [Microtetraspora sp. NBRC 13810]GLW12309.1 membrane protein [Microtetraspora sp. NBRC 13810]
MTHVSVRQGLLYVSIAATAWGTGGAAAALLYRVGDLGPVAVSFWRFAVGAALLAAFRLLTAGRPRRRARLSARHVVLTGAGMAISQSAYFAAIESSGVAIATVVTLGASPVLVAVGARLALGERLGRSGALGIAAAVAGLLLLTGDGGGDGFSSAGLGWALLSAVTYAGVTLAGRAVRDDPLGTTLGALAVGALCVLPLALVQGVLPASADPVAAGALLGYLGAVPTALAYGLFFTGLTAVRATTASVISLVEPVGATLIGVLLLGERLAPLAAAGAGVLLLAVLLLALAERD